MEAQILAIEAKNDLEKLKARTMEERQQLEDCARRVRQLEAVRQRARDDGVRLRTECERVGALFGVDELLARINEEIDEWDPEKLELEIESMHARLEMNEGAGGAQMLKAFEDRQVRITELITKRDEASAALEDLDGEITTIRDQWEPSLDRLIVEISEAFAENFTKIQCAGEVSVHKDEDFEAWAIQIKVKFRENEPLTQLDNMRQSGGERAVSTIFYLMALQSLARAPFRVVDEINQGMDPRNERLVHSRMVDIACAESSASQYFLITPKLLGGLRYHESMKVHCIASGEYMPKDYRELDFGALAQRALAVRGGAAAA
ncbi:Structural maintenance of chromosomes protein 5 [Teratosphaeriaceae sp. CCFEE 6253]|nr:Structural maintenance of chromosomes protein 5 [Teratosphaeriaceae sp. CCFEE 6253]